MKTPRSISVHLCDDTAFLFKGDVEASVSIDGILTVLDYEQRDSGEYNGFVFAAAAGTWSRFCVSPYVYPELKKAVA